MTGPFLSGWTPAVLLGAWLWGSFLNTTVDPGRVLAAKNSRQKAVVE